MTIDLVLAGERYPVNEDLLAENAGLFTQRPDLFTPSYHIRSSVHPNSVRLLVNALEGRTIDVTNDNYSSLSRLSSEFGVPELTAKLSRHRSSPDFADLSPADASLRLAVIEERLAQQSHRIERLESELARLRPPSDADPEPFRYADAGPPDDDLLADLARLSARARPASGRVECAYAPAYPLVGVVAWLNARAGGNAHDFGDIEITASSRFSDKPRDAARNLADIGEESRFCSDDRAGGWICYDFKGATVEITNYSVRSCYNGVVGGTNPKSWVVEASGDGENWVEIDRREDNDELNGANLIATFGVADGPPARFVRLRMIGKNHGGNDRIILSAIEFFGVINI